MDKYPENKSFSLIRANLEHFPEIPTSCLAVDIRRNKIKEISKIECRDLKYLDISDNLLKDISSLTDLNDLEILDCAYNLLRNVPILDLPNLKELYLMSNDIERIENINFERLNKLDMANNKINKIENINSNTLTELYLGANSIREVTNLKQLKNLKILDLQYNDINVLDCKEIPSSVEILLLQGNKNLTALSNVEMLRNLKTVGIKDTSVICDFGDDISVW